MKFISNVGFPLSIFVNFCLLAEHSLAAPCDLAPVTSKTPTYTSIDLMGQSTEVIVRVSWKFEEQKDGLIRILEVASAELKDFNNKVLPLIASKAAIPRDDCDVNSSIDGYSASPRGPSLLLRFDISATKWTCPGMDVPCPTFSQPLRFCYKRLAKTVLGKGNGWYEATFVPKFKGNDILLDVTENSDFSVNNVLGLGGTFGSMFGGIANSLANVGKFSVPYPELKLTNDDLQSGDNALPVKWNWANERAYFRSVSEQTPGGPQNGALELVRERSTAQRPAVTCVFRDEVQH
ncbi:hypothetical protein ACQR1I_19825 [Bradyrhizobium sp. HKCCYLS2038]|uniref:hypothetical protein n=1 Tax=Bradyrhizobium sp. HKCCYLS2038 TaxID=3420764 RepID=UPI003EB89489